MRTEASRPTFEPIGTALARAFDAMIAEARAERDEHLEHVVDCDERLRNLLNLRAVMDAPPAPETHQ